MEDIFDQIEQKLKEERFNDELRLLLQEFPWNEEPLPMNNRLQRIAHWFLVDGNSMEDIADKEGVSRERIRQLKDRAISFLRTFDRNNIRAIVDQVNKPAEIKKYDFDLAEVMIEPDERSELMKRLLSCNLEDFHLTTRTFNGLKGAKMNTLGDVLSVPSCNEFLKYRNFGIKSLHEVETFLHSLGFKWRNMPHEPQPLQHISNLHRLIILNSNYPLTNFTWTNTLLSAFADNKIETIEHLSQSKYLLTYKCHLPETDMQLLRNRMKEWGIKWE